jgi:PAS domain S-box-containing protein
LLEGVVDYAIIMLDRDGRIVSWNSGAERLFGYRTGEIIGKHVSCFSAPEVVQQGHPQRELQLAADQGRCQCDEWRIRKDGSRFLAHVTVTALRDESGALWGFANVTRDITEREQAGGRA